MSELHTEQASLSNSTQILKDSFFNLRCSLEIRKIDSLLLAGKPNIWNTNRKLEL